MRSARRHEQPVQWLFIWLPRTTNSTIANARLVIARRVMVQFNPYSTPSMHLHHTRYGSGKPLLLVHGIGGSSRSWSTILDELATHR